MKTPPYFPVYPKDQLTNGKLLSLSPAAFRAYHLLLYQSWTEEVTASLPDDDALLACYARMSCPEWLEVKTEVFALFTRRKDSRWYIDWLRTEFERMRNFQKSRQRAAEKRWEGKKNDKKTASCKPQKEEVLNARALHKECTSNADAMHVECFSSSHANTPTEDKSSFGVNVAASPPPIATSKPRDWLWDWVTDFCTLAVTYPKGRLGKAVNSLRKAAPTQDQCKQFEAYWMEMDWRGQQGQTPTPEQICSEWGKAMRYEPLLIEPGNSTATLVPIGGKNGKPQFTDKQDRDAQRTQDNLRYIEELRAGLKSRNG